PITFYNTIRNYMVTDIQLDEVTYLASQASGYSFNQESFYSVAGETVMGERFEEYYADETALYELILEVFYYEVE
ncbi:MAG: LytR family transcriptional regulator, partial [Lachnospiraceae bacterium]|nr:LytR family transcriptional regulator [Lachnospiraceae bacterium]